MFEPQSDTVVATFHSEGYKPLADITLPHLARYAREHRYDLYSEQYEDDLRKIGWARFERVFYLLQFYKTVFWCDADALVTNFRPSVESFPGEIVMCADLHGPNTGVFIARSTNLVKQLFYVILGNYGQSHFGDHQWGEQAAFIHLIQNPPYREIVNFVDQHKLNAYPKEGLQFPDFVSGIWERGDFIVQFVGIDIRDRVSLAKKYAGMICT